MRNRMNHEDRICYKALFSLWSEIPVERWQEEKFEFVRSMGLIFVAMMAGVRS